MADNGGPKLLRLIKAYFASTKMKVRASESDSMFLTFSPAFDRDVLSPLPSSIK